MPYSRERAIGCRIGYNAVIKALRYVEDNDRIPPHASTPLRQVLQEIYGGKMYQYYSHRPARLRRVA